MAKFRRGADAIKAAATRTGGGKFTPTFKFDTDKPTYIQFLTELDDIPTVLMHRFIIVGQREDGKPIYEHFISRRDPILDGPEGYDPLADRFGVNPTNRTIALAVELEPVWSGGSGTRKTIKGFDIATRQFTTKDDETKEVPAVALIIESPFTFFDQLTAIADMGEEITEKVFAVKRNGKGTDTSYTLLPVGDALDFEDELDEFFEDFDFEAYLDDLADEDRVHEFIDPLPDDAKVTMYPPKGKAKDAKAAKEKPKTSTRTRRAPAPEPEPEEDPDEIEADFASAEEEPEEQPKRRPRKFSELARNSAR